MGDSDRERTVEHDLVDRIRIAPRRIERTGDDSPAEGLFHYVWRMSGYHQVSICLIAVVVALVGMAPLELQRRIINDAIGGSDLELLFWLAGIYLAVILAQSGTKLAMRTYQAWLSESAIRYTREHLITLRSRRTDARDENDANGAGNAVSVIGAEIDKLGGFVGESLSQPVVNLGMVLALLGYMLIVDPLVATTALVFLLPQVAIVPWLQNVINRLLERRLLLLRRLGDEVADIEPDDGEGSDRQPLGSRGLTVDVEQTGETLDSIYANRIRIEVVKYIMKSLTNLLSALGPLTVLAVGGYYVLSGETSLGVVVAFMTGFDRLADPLRELLNYYRLAAQAAVQHEMVANWVRAELEEPGTP